LTAPSFEPLFDGDQDAEEDDAAVAAELLGGATLTGKSKKSKPSKHADLTRELFFAPRKRIVNKHREYRDWTWACDLLFPPRVGRSVTVFCAVELTSRLGFATITDRTAAGTIQCLNKLVKRVGADRVQHMNFDLGSEFDNARVKAWVAKHCAPDVPGEPARPWYYDSHSTAQKGTIEAFNRTVRYALAISSKVSDPYWTDATLDEICAEYNAQRHSGMRGATPNDAAGTGQESALLRGLIRYKAAVDSEGYVKALSDFKHGDRVRVWVGADPKFSPAELDDKEFAKKAGQRWTDEVYTVDRVGSAAPASSSSSSSSSSSTRKAAGWYITLEGVGTGTAAGARRFSPRDLLKVASDAPDASAVVPAKVSAQALEGFKTQTARARHDALVARFLKRENLHEASAEHAARAAVQADEREAVLRRGFADSVDAAPAPAAAGTKRTRRSAAAAAAAAAPAAPETATATAKRSRRLASASAPAPSAPVLPPPAKAKSSTDSLLAKAREGFKQFLSTKQGQAFRQAATRGVVRSPRDLKLR
jgi:hypothetical protein